MKTKLVKLDHMSIPVKKWAAAKKFYVGALGAIGMKVNMEFDDAFGMGSKKQLIVWIGKKAKATGGVHLALHVDNRKDVDAFYKAAIKAGGKDNGKPGIRKDYAPNYYAAFVHDPDGNNIEVVCYAKK